MPSKDYFDTGASVVATSFGEGAAGTGASADAAAGAATGASSFLPQPTNANAATLNTNKLFIKFLLIINPTFLFICK